MTAIKNNTVRLFEQVKTNDQLRGIALDIYSILCRTPGLTGGEIFLAYERLRPVESERRGRAELSKRISDLANWGAIKADGITVCPLSGRKAQRWTPTGKTEFAKSKLRLASVSDEKVTFSGTQAAKTTHSLAGAVQNLGRLLGMEVSSQTAESLLVQARAIAGDSFSFEEASAQIASAKAAEKLACDLLKAAQIRAEKAESALAEKASVAPETKSQLRALANRTRMVLNFKWVMTKAYRAQAEKTLAALEDALNSL